MNQWGNCTQTQQKSFLGNAILRQQEHFSIENTNITSLLIIKLQIM